MSAGGALRLRDVLRYRAAHDADATFLIFEAAPGEVESFTYGEFHERVLRLAGGLRAMGLRSGDRCVLHLPNGVAFLLAFWALQELDVVAVPTIAQYSADELAYVVDHAGAWGVLTDAEHLEKVHTLTDGRPEMRVAADAPAAPAVASFDELMRAGGSPAAVGDVDGDGGREEAIILYTSGSTARPKGVLLGHRSSLFTGESYAHHFRLQPADRVLTCMPLFHVSGLFLQMLPVAMTGATLVLTPKFSLSNYWRWVREHDVTVAHLPNGPLRLLGTREPAPDDARNRLRLMTQALPLDTDEMVAFERRFGVPLGMVWGMTESSGGGTFMPPYFNHRPEHQAVGPQMLGWEVRVVGDDGAELPPGEPGELTIRAPGLMLGYLDDPEATAATIRDGWLHTGDVGYKDADGCVHFVERLKDMIKRSGENVAAGEIERVILEHPDVAACAVVGVPDPLRGEAIVAFAVPAPGADTLDPAELIAFCDDRLAWFKVPQQVEIRPELPLTSIGKVQKGELRKEAAAVFVAPSTPR
jgi:acyl-CoA synthetase (AMP-forming)/AMP-acid ligase II